MVDISKHPCPPYATFTPFLGFLNKLRDTQIPSRIDPSVFGNASGSLSYSIIAALKVLKLIGPDGAPKPMLVRLVDADDGTRKSIMQEVLPAAYPTFFNGSFDITKATSGQFDEHLRTHYEAKGSTIDKVASFFIAAAAFAGVEVSQLVKDRKPIATSASSNKSKKQRKAAQEEQIGNSNGGVGTTHQQQQTQISEKALEYRLVDLMSDAINNPDVMSAIITVVTFLKTRDATPKKTAAEPSLA